MQLQTTPFNIKPLAGEGLRQGFPVTRISASNTGIFRMLGDLVRFRSLVQVFIWRDLRVRYNQAWIGAAWAILQPLLLMIIFSVFLGRLGKFSGDGIPYPIFVLSGIIVWQMFLKAFSQASTSLRDNRSIITKVYFPRIILPFAVIAGALVDFLFAFLVLIPMMFYFNIYPLWPNVLAAPLFVLLALMMAFSVGLWFSVLDIKFGDIRQLLPVMMQLWFFMSPVIYPPTLVPAGIWRQLYMLNPMAGAVTGFRWALLEGAPPPEPVSLAISICLLMLFLIGGLLFFRRFEGSVIDLI